MVLAKSECRLAVTVEFGWRFTVKKPSRGCRILQLHHAVFGFCVLGGGLFMLQFCRSLSTWSALFVSHPRSWYPLHDPAKEMPLIESLTAGELSLGDCLKLSRHNSQAFTGDGRAVTQRPVSQETAMAKAETLPSTCYETSLPVQ